mmetsp:Transcript_3083/g.6281  ORF Transcript_3083/g.6281 Transcript_3083/m.6281 type:complete len:430 (+) Transcript_3083:254-1543(+)
MKPISFLSACQLLALSRAFTIPSSRLHYNYLTSGGKFVFGFGHQDHHKFFSRSISVSPHREFEALKTKQRDSKTTTSLHVTTTPVFDFTLKNATTKQKSANSFERIDDAIMGGISQSSLRDVPDKDYASWSGVCRTDGGGFCGTRTLPFKSAPLNATNQDGVFMDCNLASDDEPEKRIWKFTVRTDTSRGEMVYQAQFDLKAAIDKATLNSNADTSDTHPWARVMVPFDQFQLVRGPRLVPDGPKLDVSGGIFQIGMTLSKFQIAANTTQLEDFRPGYFNLHIQSIGFYRNEAGDNGVTNGSGAKVPDTFTKKEAESKRPLVLKLLLPVAKLLFSEQANRRRSAMNILREKRGLKRPKAILFGIRSRRMAMGLLPSVMKTLGIIGIDAFRTGLKTLLKIVFVYPSKLVFATVRNCRKMLGMKAKPSSAE